MTNLVRAELVKWRTTRSFYGNTLGLVVIIALAVAAAIVTTGTSGSAGLDSTEGLRSVFAAGADGGFLVLIMGIISVTGEYRHNTITGAVLITPRRSRLIVAKAVAMAIVGAVMALVAVTVTLVVALPWLAAKDVSVSLVSSDVGLVLLGAVAVTVCFGLIGVGIGSIVRNQVGAIVGSLAWLLVAESLIVGLVPAVGKWLAFGASGSLLGSVDEGLLPAGAAAVLLVGYAGALMVGGVRLTAKRDITA